MTRLSLCPLSLTERMRLRLMIFAMSIVISRVVTADATADDLVDRIAAIPAVDLSRLEPEVAKQLQSVQRILREVISRADATSKRRANAFGEYGRVLQAYRYDAEATACYRLALAEYPDEFRWLHLLGCSLESAGQLADAEAAFKKALTVATSTATRVRLGNVLMQQNRRDEARAIFASLIRADSGLSAAYAGAGLLALEERDYNAAIRHLRRALELAPAANRLHYSLAMAYRGAGDIDQARLHLKLRGDVGLRPDDPLLDELNELIRGTQVHIVRGKIALAAGATADAVREFQLALAASPDHPAAHINLAVALTTLKRPDPAIEHLRAALKIDSQNKTAQFNLASLLYSRGESIEAAEWLRKLLKSDPLDTGAQLLLARTLVAQRRTTDAIEGLIDATRKLPDDESLTVFLADLWQEQKKYAEAIGILSDAADRHPDRGITAHALARLLARSIDEEFRDDERAVKLAVMVYEARQTFEHAETVAMAWAACGRFHEAISLQKQLLATADNMQAPAVSARIRANLQRYENGQRAE